jgi:hypothetical protein
MTEISVNNEEITRYLVDPVAFFLALLGGPALFTLLTCWLVIPVFALAFGVLPYLLIGTPLLLIYLRRRPVTPRAISWLAFHAFVAAWVIYANMLYFAFPGGAASSALWVLPFGAIFAPCWGACFGMLYRGMARDFYSRPRPA